MTLHPIPLNFLIYEKVFISFFSVNDRVLVHYTQCITISTEHI
jgi:hypothetical protein